MQNQIEDSGSDIWAKTRFLQRARDQQVHGTVGSHATQIKHAGKHQPHCFPQKLLPFPKIKSPEPSKPEAVKINTVYYCMISLICGHLKKIELTEQMYGYQGGEGWMGWTGRLGLTYIHYYVWNRTYCIARGTLLNALWWPKWEGNPKKRGYMYTYSCFTLLYSRN